MFSHLHCHTEHSKLDGLSKIEDLILKAKELGQPAIAITDHGTTSGLYEAFKLSEKHEFKVLYGSEFYFENADNAKKHGHLILIAKDNKGLENLFRIQADANLNNFYYKPRVNLDILKKYSEGLICLSACMANQIAQYILKDECVLALSHLHELKSIYGDDFYLELQSSTMPEQIIINKKYKEFVEQGFAKCVITNDVHYTLKEDAYAHEVLLAIQQNKKMNDPKRWKFTVNDFWLKSEEEIKHELSYINDEIYNSAISNISRIVDSCNVTFESSNYLPHFKGMNNDEENEELERLTMEKYIAKVCDRKEGNAAFLSDIYTELSVIRETGYSGYFLIVQEYINWAKNNNILVGDGRGSGAGSKVAYTVGITEINPQKYNLLFERFLSVGREPDFDVDFSDIESVYGHLQSVYGITNVARVGAYSRLTAKSAIIKTLSAFGFSTAEIARIKSYLPNRLSFTLDEALTESNELSSFFDRHDNILYVLRRLEGKIDHMSTHAGGVIICDDLAGKLPLMLVEGKLVTELDKYYIAELGHYKFDILGLKSLNLLDMVLSYLPNRIDWHDVDFEDRNVYNMLCDGDVSGVFQLADQKHKVVEQQPKCFEDLIAINALIRPGVGDWNEYIKRRRNEFNTDDVPSYLRSTSGIIVYQEQYLLLANTYAGWDIAFSDKRIRKIKIYIMI